MLSLEDREYQMDRLEFVKNQLNLLIQDIKMKIKTITEEVEAKVTDPPWPDATALQTPLRVF